jgi:hypothetical protein
LISPLHLSSDTRKITFALPCTEHQNGGSAFTSAMFGLSVTARANVKFPYSEKAWKAALRFEVGGGRGPVAPPVFKTGLAANIVAGGFDSLPPPPPFPAISLLSFAECHQNANRRASRTQRPYRSRRPAWFLGSYPVAAVNLAAPAAESAGDAAPNSGALVALVSILQVKQTNTGPTSAPSPARTG